MEIKNDQMNGKMSYTKPEMKKHDPIKVMQGSGGGCSGYLYYTSLYYTLYYTYYYYSLYYS